MEFSKKILLFIYKKGEQILSDKGLDRYYIIRTVSRKLRSKIKSDFIELNGNKMFLDSEDSLRLSINKTYEPFETKVITPLLKKDNTVLDIGANIGYYTLLFAKLVGPKGKIFSFEPEDENFDLLSKNVEINNYSNVHLIQSAVSNKDGKIPIFTLDKNKAGHTLSNPNIKEKKCVEVNVVSLDNYFKDFDDEIDFIKMDIEGSEMDALEGMSSLLDKSENLIIMVEFAPYLIKRMNREPEEFVDLFRKKGFKIFYINRKKKKVIPINYAELIKKYKPSNENHTNLLCVKGKINPENFNF